jgi:6-phosphogluconolactonase
MTEPGGSVSWAAPGDAEAVAGRIADEVARPGAKRIAVPGGSTPLRIFELLAARQLDWRTTTLMLGDDRQVPVDHPASNFGKLSAALGHTGATLAPLVEGAEVAPFDLVWLGMGADGHVASLFPQMTARELPGARVIATVPEPLPPEAPFPRLTLNLAALLQTREIILVVTGAAKRELLEKAVAGEAADLPVARLLQAAAAPVTIYWS